MNIPGLIDLQVNGYRGVDFSSPELTEDELVRACRGILNSGPIAFLITVVTSSAEVYERNLGLIASVMQRDEFKGRIPGIHIEGPFISGQDGARGAHLLMWVRKPDIELFRKMLNWSGDTIKLLTIAAELEGSDDLCRYAVEHGVCVSLGHQMAVEKDIALLAGAGARGLTHLGNGIPSMIQRHDNAIWGGLANDNLFAMIITDGHHLPPSLIKTIVRSKGVEKVVVVSDQTSVAGLEPGEYKLFGDAAILTEQGRLYNPNTGYLAGSGRTILECFDYLSSLDILTDEELAQVFYYNPLKLINLSPEDVVCH